MNALSPWQAGEIYEYTILEFTKKWKQATPALFLLSPQLAIITQRGKRELPKTLGLWEWKESILF